MFLSSAFRALCLGAALLTVSGEGICVINSCDDLAACASATNPVTDDTTGKTTYTIDFSACKPLPADPSEGVISWACCAECDAVTCTTPVPGKKCDEVTTMSVTVDKCVESVTIKVHDGNLRGDEGVSVSDTCFGGDGGSTNCGDFHLCDVEIALTAPDCEEEEECITCDGENEYEEYGFKAANTFYLCVKDPGTDRKEELFKFPCPIGQPSYKEGDVIVYLGEDCLEETTIDRAHKLVDANGEAILTSKGKEQFRDLSNFARVCVNEVTGDKSCIKKCDLAWGADSSSSMVCKSKIDNVDTLVSEDDITGDVLIEFVSPTCVLPPPEPERRLGGPRFW